MKDSGLCHDGIDATASASTKLNAPPRCLVGMASRAIVGIRTLQAMAQATISQLRHSIRALNYVVSTHAAEALDDDDLSILDLENIVLTGHIAERQRDTQTREAKYVVAGAALDGTPGEAVVKIGFGGKLIVITVYLC